MVPYLEFGSIKSRCLKLTDKKQFPSSICAVYTACIIASKQPLRYLNKNRPVFAQLILYCQRGLHLEVAATTTPYCVFTADFVLIWCFFCSVSVPPLAQLCHFFLSSRNTISDLTSSLLSAKLHVFECAGQNDSTS